MQQFVDEIAFNLNFSILMWKVQTQTSEAKSDFVSHLSGC